jgi:hypothetical protein
MRRFVRICVATLLGIGSTVLLAAPASAHEARDVGRYHFLVGWGNEPAYAGFQNNVYLQLSYRSSGKPVTTLGNTLKVAVDFGSKGMNLTMIPTFDPDSGLGTPGVYVAYLIPTAVGNYEFHFTGSILGQKVNEVFKSGPKTFDPVTDPSTVQFPQAAPNTIQLNTKLDQEVARLQAAASLAKSSANSARTLGVIAIFLGAVGVVMGGLGLVLRRRHGAAP